MKFIFILGLSFFNCFLVNLTAESAEKINLKFEGMSIPVSIDELSKLGKYKEDSLEVIDWFKENGLGKVFQLSKYLEVVVFKQDSFSEQILRSWMGRKILTEFSNTFKVQNDTNGIQLFDTIERLLDEKKEVSILDILKEIPIYEIELDIDNLISIIYSWKKALEEQQNLSKKLNALENNNNIIINFDLFDEKDLNFLPRKINLDVSHREKPLSLELWIPNKDYKKNLIIFMPGLGGDISNFRWLGAGLSKKGWPILLIEHEGSNLEALKAVMRGEQSLPGGTDIFLYRIKDLNAVVKAYKDGALGFDGRSYILMGHSLGSLISMLYEGNLPEKDFESRCNIALKDFALTNLSKLLQCQLLEIPILEFEKSTDLKAIVGFNSFGSLIWPYKNNTGINAPVLLIGGTFDLITPLVSEQFKLFRSNQSNKLNRFLIVQGASHFSPISVNNQSSKNKIDNDVFKIKENFIGINPSDFQKLSLKIIIEFLSNLERKQGLKVVPKNQILNLNYHLLGEKELNQIYKD